MRSFTSFGIVLARLELSCDARAPGKGGIRRNDPKSTSIVILGQEFRNISVAKLEEPDLTRSPLSSGLVAVATGTTSTPSEPKHPYRPVARSQVAHSQVRANRCGFKDRRRFCRRKLYLRCNGSK